MSETEKAERELRAHAESAKHLGGGTGFVWVGDLDSFIGKLHRLNAALQRAKDDETDRVLAGWLMGMGEGDG